MGLTEKRNEIINRVLKEMLAVERQKDVLAIDWFIKRQYLDSDSFERERIIDTMQQHGLIAKEEPTSIWPALTEFGKQIAESEIGWIGYVKSQNEQADKPPTIIVEYKKHWYDTPLKILALIETVIIIVCAIIGVNIQSNSKQLEREKLQLSDTLAIRNQKLSDLEGLLEKKSKEIEEIEKSLKSSRDGLKVKK